MGTTAENPSNPPISVLFVCLGNICRSPMAEAVFKSTISKSHQEKSIAHIDSCGTGAYHVGDAPDPRTLQVLDDHGIDGYTHAARKIRADDFVKFDYILAMDRSNLYDLQSLRRKNNKGGAVKDEEEEQQVGDGDGDGETGRKKGQLMLFGDFGGRKGEQVGDPYYGASDGFAIAYEQMERFSQGFIAQILNGGESHVK